MVTCLFNKDVSINIVSGVIFHTGIEAEVSPGELHTEAPAHGRTCWAVPHIRPTNTHTIIY